MKLDILGNDAQTVAHSLLGKYLVRRVNGKTKAYKITETEAYVGPHDKASHAHRGKTKRNEVMFGPPGHWYVYFTYGMHYMLNIVTGKRAREKQVIAFSSKRSRKGPLTGPAGYPSAVLIRGIIGPISNYSFISSNKRIVGVNQKKWKVLDGPGKMTKALKITQALNSKSATKKSGLWIEDHGVKVRLRDIKKTPRIGIHY